MSQRGCSLFTGQVVERKRRDLGRGAAGAQLLHWCYTYAHLPVRETIKVEFVVWRIGLHWSRSRRDYEIFSSEASRREPSVSLKQLEVDDPIRIPPCTIARLTVTRTVLPFVLDLYMLNRERVSKGFS